MPVFSLGTLGCGGGCECCSVTFCLACSGTPVSGATVTVTTDSGSPSGTTNSSGCVSLAIPAAGSYTVTIESETCASDPMVYTMSLACTDTYNIDCCSCPETVCVYGCGDTPLAGVQVQFLDAEGGPACSTPTNCEGYTGSNGCWTVALGVSDPVDYIATATYDGTEATQTFSGCSDTLNFYNTCVSYYGCSGPEAGAAITVNGIEQVTNSSGEVCFFLPTGSYSISVTPPTGRVTCTSGMISAGACEIYSSCTLTDGYVCCACLDPICKTLTLVDSVLGNVTLTANAGNPCTGSGFTDWWVGTLSLSWGGACGCPAQTVTVCYQYTCNEGSDTPATLAISVCLGDSTGCETDECPGACPGSGSYPMPAPTLVSDQCDPLETVFGANYGCNCGAAGLCICNNDGSAFPTAWALWGSSYPTAVTWTILDECSP